VGSQWSRDRRDRRGRWLGVTIEVSVVIPVLDGAETLADQIDAVLSQLVDDAELIIVDNGSTDTTPDIIERYVERCERVRAVHVPVRGVNRARNAGVDVASGRFILLCDADDIVQQGWLEGFRAALGRADLVGGVLIGRDSTGAEVELPDPRKPQEWELSSPWGCCCAFRRETWARVGGFDDRMSGAFDEFDFFLRAQLLGATLVWSDDAAIRYSWDPSEAKRYRWWREQTYHSCRVYWMGLMLGRPRRIRMLRELAWLATRAPLALFSARRRSDWNLMAVRRWDRLRGFVRFGVPEIWRGLSDRRTK
jgi:glycosyltransferase involved in cell wall biosynthesis